VLFNQGSVIQEINPRTLEPSDPYWNFWGDERRISAKRPMTRFFNKHFWLVHLAFLAIMAWMAADLATSIIQERLPTTAKWSSAKSPALRPVEKAKPYEWYAPIPERNIFNPAEKGLKLIPLQEKKGPTLAGADASVSRGAAGFNFRLVGTITGPGEKAWAIVQEKTGSQQKIIRQREEIQGWKVVRISRDEVVLDHKGKKETLSFEAEPAPGRRTSAPAAAPSSVRSDVRGDVQGDEVRKVSANRFLVNREEVNQAVGNINEFMTQARLKPYFEGGKPAGFSVSEIQRGSLIERLGLRHNDIIRKVNGQVLTKPEEIFYVYSQLLQDSTIEVEIQRGGRVEVFQYEIR